MFFQSKHGVVIHRRQLADDVQQPLSVLAARRPSTADPTRQVYRSIQRSTEEARFGPKSLLSVEEWGVNMSRSGTEIVTTCYNLFL